MRLHSRRACQRTVVVLALLYWLPCVFWYRSAESEAAPPLPLASGTTTWEDVVVVSQTPGQCSHRGTYFATKAAQTKLQLAQRRGWRLWITGDESEGLASAAALATGNDTAAASQLGLLLALHEARPPPRWLLWLDSELLVTNPSAELPLAEYEARGTQLVLWGEEGGAGSDKLVVDAAVLALRVGTWSAALLAAALNLATESTARSRHHTGRSASALLAELLRAPCWRQRTQLERERPLFAHWRSVVPLLAPSDARAPPSASGAMPAASAPLATSFRGCGLCAATAPPASLAACREALMRSFTYASNFALRPLGAQHAVLGSTHVRPTKDGSDGGGDGGGGGGGGGSGGGGDGERGGRWLSEHRDSLGQCLASLVVVGSQRSGLASLHGALKRGWDRRVRVHAGEREQHFFSMDNRFRQGLLHHQRLFHPNTTALRSCADRRSASAVLVELSSSYFDYPKAKLRIFSVMPRVRVAVLLREPVARALSAFNVRWLTWLCGKLMWSRTDCWAAVTGEEVVRQNQVGPFQMHAALKLWRACTGGGDGKEGAAPSVSCLRADYASKLRDKTTQELAALHACVARAHSAHPTTNLGDDGDGGSEAEAEAEAIFVPPVGGASWGEGIRWDSCLELDGPMTGPKQLHKKMEDGAFVWRSMYQVHLSGWLAYFPASQMLLLDPAELFAPERSRRDAAMGRLARHIGLSRGAKTRDGPASESVAHENNRHYILPPQEQPAEIGEQLSAWLAPHNCALAALVRRHRLASDDLRELPWLQKEVGGKECR